MSGLMGVTPGCGYHACLTGGCTKACGATTLENVMAEENEGYVPGACAAKIRARRQGLVAIEHAEDALSRSKRILGLVDIYVERPDKMNRTALRVALMVEFEDAMAQGRDA